MVDRSAYLAFRFSDNIPDKDDKVDNVAEDYEDDLELSEVIRTTYDPPPAPPAMEPLYQVHDDGSLPGE